MRTPSLLLCFLPLLWLTSCSPKTNKPAQPTTNAVADAKQKSDSSNPITAPVDYLGAVGRAKQLAEKTVDTAQLNQAIQNFYLQEDRYPANFQELVKEGLLAKVPQAPYGMRILYNPRTGEVRIVRVQGNQ